MIELCVLDDECTGPFPQNRDLASRDFVFISWAPKRYLKMEPKQGPKLDPNQNSKTQSRGANLVGRRRQGSCRHDLQSVVYSAFQMSAANQELQPKKERKLGLTNLLKQRACVRLQAKHSQDMTPLQKIHSAVSRMGK